MTTTEPMVMVLFDYEEIGIIWLSGGRVVTGDVFFFTFVRREKCVAYQGFNDQGCNYCLFT